MAAEPRPSLTERLPYSMAASIRQTRLSGSVEELLTEAQRLAAVRGHPIVGTEHLLLAMTGQSTDTVARRLLDEVGVTAQLRTRIEAAIGEE
jgi:ATP-dependent Clp protease ATP-binding subunit ClpA